MGLISSVVASKVTTLDAMVSMCKLCQVAVLGRVQGKGEEGGGTSLYIYVSTTSSVSGERIGDVAAVLLGRACHRYHIVFA